MTETPAPPRRLHRSRSDRMLGGVCGGLGEYAAIDPVIFRVALVVSALFGGFGIVLYLIAWMLLPDSPGRPAYDDRSRIVVLALAVLIGLPLLLFTLAAGSMLLLPFGGLPGSGEFLLLGVLIAVLVMVLLLRNPSAPAPPLDPYAEAAPPATWTPPPPKPRSPLAAITVSVMLLVVGVLAALDVGDVGEVPTEAYLGAGLTVIGAGLVAAAWLGRARILVGYGLVLCAVLAIGWSGGEFWVRTDSASIGGTEITYFDSRPEVSRPARPAEPLRPFTPPLRSGPASAKRLIQPRTIDEMPLLFSVGEFDVDSTLDASTVDFAGARHTTTAMVDDARARIIVPRDVEVTVQGSARRDTVTLFGRPISEDALRAGVTERVAKSRGQFVIYVDITGIGRLEVRHAA